MSLRARDLAAGELLGRHVGRRAGADRLTRTRPARPKSVMRTLAAAVEHDVGRLEVAVEDAALVRRGEAGADLARDLEAALLREAADAPEQRREILAVHVLHRQERVPVDLADVVDAADVGMRDLARHAHFGVELRQARGIAIDVRRQELQRDRLPELQIVGAIDLAHAAAAEAADDAVAAAEQRAGSESGRDRWRRRWRAIRLVRCGSDVIGDGAVWSVQGGRSSASGSPA